MNPGVAQTRNDRRSDHHNTDEAGDDLRYMDVTHGHQQDRRQRTNRPEGTVLQEDELLERLATNQVDRDRTDKHRTDQAEAQGDDDWIGSDRESADDTVE